MGHFGVHATLRALRDNGHVWVLIAQWIAECPTCQKYRVSGKEVVTIPSPITSFQVIEELGMTGIKKLAVPFSTKDYYLPFSRKFFAETPAVALRPASRQAPAGAFR